MAPYGGDHRDYVLDKGHHGTRGHVDRVLLHQRAEQQAGKPVWYNAKQADVYAVGITVARMCGVQPDADTPVSRLEVDKWDGVSGAAKNFILTATTEDLSKRKSLSQLLAHSWLTRDVAVEF